MKPPPRELEILRAIAHGKTQGQVATKLHITEEAVRESLVKTRERYGANNNEAAVASAVDKEHIPASSMPAVVLTGDEQDLLERLAYGQTNKELRAELHLSESGVDARVGKLLRKMGARSRPHAVFLGYRQGVLVGYRDRRTRSARDSERQAVAAIAVSTDLADAARALKLSENTVKSYIQRSKRRHGAKTTPQLVALSIRTREIQCPPSRETTARALDPQERQLFALMVTGLRDPAIASAMRISTRTLERLIPGALQKLHAKSRSHAVYILFQQKVLS